MQLQELKAKIDDIDDRIASLYDQRMKLIKEASEKKTETNRYVQDLTGENATIGRVTKAVDEDVRVYCKQVFETLFETGHAYQSRFVRIPSGVAEEIRSNLESGLKAFPNYATVACQGVEGAYSMIATTRLFPLSDITYFKNFEGVFHAVEKGLCKYGMLPIENSSVGSVNDVYDLMKEHKFYIVRSIKLHVQHHLLAKQGVKLSEIKEVFSHEQALNQCKKWLGKTDIKVTVVPNTAVAAKMVAESERTDVACISSRECASLYGLNVLAANMQDNDNNYTRFILISKKMEIFKKANRVSIMVNLPHTSGSLNRMLNKFSTLGFNLTKLESRPLPNSAFEFMFYFDFEADIENPEVVNLFAELENGEGQLVFLGSYYEVV
ncbi:MAG: bifunctional chorismate mutase/prephenate dehydratase [Clostridiales bacterium]|nr:bifunctional chorismate mutase/prephenate dehydratase [Clostridiales bacterium]